MLGLHQRHRAAGDRQRRRDLSRNPTAPIAARDVPRGLRWVSDRDPGLRRVRSGRGFVYRDAKGRAVRDEKTLQRIRSLAIPPAYEDVWICARSDGHLQATGRDAAGRKQYRYHPSFQAQRGDAKFERLLAFGLALPRIRRRVARDLKLPAAGSDSAVLQRQRVLGALARLLDATFVRVGNDEYARTNNSFGLTTLRNRHAGVRGDEVLLRFRGKGGQPHEVRLADRRIAAVVRRCQALPGQELFQYVDEAGRPRRIDSGDVNAYLAEAAGLHVTAKDFRTWHGSVLALELAQAPEASITSVLAGVSQALRNTPAVCRKAYVHPGVLETLAAPRGATVAAAAPAATGLRAAEQRLLRLLRALGRAK